MFGFYDKVYFLLFFGVVLVLDLERRWGRGREDLDMPLLYSSQVKTDGPNQVLWPSGSFYIMLRVLQVIVQGLIKSSVILTK